MRKSCGFLFVFLVGAVPRSQAALIEIVPSTSNLDLGESLEISLQISSLGAFVPPSLGAFDVDLTFDSSILSFDSESYGDPVLGDQLGIFFPSITFTTPMPGVVNLFQLSLDFPDDLDSLQSSRFTLVTLMFETIAAGASPLSMDVNALSDSFGVSLGVDTLGAIVTVKDVRAVPEPSTPWLLLLAGAGICARARRHKTERNDAVVADAR